MEKGRIVPESMIVNWQLLPAGTAKQFPDYIPSPILEDYKEASAIRKLSPKASATLSRRALQGMIRDFWGIKKARLKDEIDAIQDRIDPVTWTAIDDVRQIGNIGAHMERDIDVIIEVEEGEAELLIGLVETLLKDWYIDREERKQRMAKLRAAAEEKKALQETSRPNPAN